MIRLLRSKPEVVTTLRDRTELVSLQPLLPAGESDLGSSMQATETSRAQTQDFANRLHTVRMLIQLGDTDAAVDDIDAVSRDRSQLDSSVLTRTAEPVVAVFMIAKTSLARERGADVFLTPESEVPRIDRMLSADLVTVLGNLLDNALEAVTDTITRVAEVDVRVVTGSNDALVPVRLDEIRVAVGDTRASRRADAEPRALRHVSSRHDRTRGDPASTGERTRPRFPGAQRRQWAAMVTFAIQRGIAGYLLKPFKSVGPAVKARRLRGATTDSQSPR
jgi:hypothetical protein